MVSPMPPGSGNFGPNSRQTWLDVLSEQAL